MSSGISESSGSGSGYSGQVQNLDFKVVLDLKGSGGQVEVHLVALTVQVRIKFPFINNYYKIKKKFLIRRKLLGLVILANVWTMFVLMNFYTVHCQTQVQ